MVAEFDLHAVDDVTRLRTAGYSVGPGAAR